MKIELYPPLSIHEIGQRDNQEDSIAQWDNRLFVLYLSKKVINVYLLYFIKPLLSIHFIASCFVFLFIFSLFITTFSSTHS